MDKPAGGSRGLQAPEKPLHKKEGLVPGSLRPARLQLRNIPLIFYGCAGTIGKLI